MNYVLASGSTGVNVFEDSLESMLHSLIPYMDREPDLGGLSPADDFLLRSQISLLARHFEVDVPRISLTYMDSAKMTKRWSDRVHDNQGSYYRWALALLLLGASNIHKITN